MNTPEHLTVSEASELFSIGRTKLYELLASGEIEAVKLGRRTLISSASVRDFMRALPAFSGSRPHCS
jgi:excisionase family DNA binding protein